jgi:hypothetical protein
MKKCGYKCVITKERFDVIHHIVSFNTILKESLHELNYELYENISNYNSEELQNIVKKVIEIHNNYGCGVCLTRAMHDKFHKIYGSGSNTKEQWDKFIGGKEYEL